MAGVFEGLRLQALVFQFSIYGVYPEGRYNTPSPLVLPDQATQYQRGSAGSGENRTQGLRVWWRHHSAVLQKAMSFLTAKIEVEQFPVCYFQKIPAENIISKINLPSEARQKKIYIENGE